MNHNKNLNEQGYTIENQFFDQTFVNRLIDDLDSWIEFAAAVRVKTGQGNTMAGVAHHILGKNDSMGDLIKRLPFDDVLREYFEGPYILNSFGGLKNVNAGKENYTHVNNFHRDVRTFSPNLTLMINMLVMLEDFTIENGATQLVPFSHKEREKPSDAELQSRSVYMTGKAGTLLAFNSNVWHAASPNTDGSTRAAITLSFTRPFVKPQINYCKLVGDNFSDDPRVMEVIGFRSRIPQCHEDWYQPLSGRFYHADQG
jgi:hypothetical protein